MCSRCWTSPALRGAGLWPERRPGRRCEIIAVVDAEVAARTGRPGVAVGLCWPVGVRLFLVGGPTSLYGGGEAGGSWIRQRVVVVRKRRRGTGVRR